MERIESLNGLTLSFQEYRERDGILTLLSEKGVFRIFTRGVQSLKSKNRRLCTPFSLVRLEVGQGRSAYWLKSGKLLKSCLDGTGLFFRVSVSLLAELLSDLTISQDLYESFLFLVENGQDEGWMNTACYVLAQILKAAGIAPYLDGCVVCHNRKGICSLSREQGGYLCRDHAYGKEPWPASRLQWVRRLFTRSWKQFQEIPRLDENQAAREFKELLSWYEYHLDLHRRILSFWKEIYSTEQTA